MKSFFVTRRLSVDVRAQVPDELEVRVFEGLRPPTRAELCRAAEACHTLPTLVSDPVDGAVLDALPTVRHASTSMLS